MSKQSERVRQLACEVAISILEEYGIDDIESYRAFKASYDLRDEEENSRLSMLRNFLWKFADNETPNNAEYIDQQLDQIKALHDRMEGIK